MLTKVAIKNCILTLIIADFYFSGKLHKHNEIYSNSHNWMLLKRPRLYSSFIFLNQYFHIQALSFAAFSNVYLVPNYLIKTRAL